MTTHSIGSIEQKHQPIRRIQLCCLWVIENINIIKMWIIIELNSNYRDVESCWRKARHSWSEYFVRLQLANYDKQVFNTDTNIFKKNSSSSKSVSSLVAFTKKKFSPGDRSTTHVQKFKQKLEFVKKITNAREETIKSNISNTIKVRYFNRVFSLNKVRL